MIERLLDWLLNMLLWNEEHSFIIDKAIMTAIIAGTAFLMIAAWM